MYGVYPEYGERSTDSRALVARSLGWMVTGLLITLAAALGVTATLSFWLPFYRGFGPWLLLLGEMALVWYLTARLRAGALEPAAARGLFLLYAASLGLLLAPALLAAPGAVVPAALVSAGMFGAAALWGATTPADLRPWGTFLFMALIGLMLAMLVNALLVHGAMGFWISLGGALLFSGLTAYDLQRIRRFAPLGEDGAILGALSLYLDFINLFLFVLTLWSGRRR